MPPNVLSMTVAQGQPVASGGLCGPSTTDPGQVLQGAPLVSSGTTVGYILDISNASNPAFADRAAALNALPQVDYATLMSAGLIPVMS